MSIVKANKWQSTAGVTFNAVLQTVITPVTAAYSHSVGSASGWVNMSQFTTSFTPRFNTSKVLITGVISISKDSDTLGLRVGRGTTYFVGDASGSKLSVTQGWYPGAAGIARMEPMAFCVVDSPATTSAVTYTFDCTSNTTGTVVINKRPDDADTANYFRMTSYIVFQEIAQ